MLSRIRDRLERWANPMLVRQMYQSLHNRKFLGAMWLLLLAALVTYVMIFVGSDTASSSGRFMFMVFSGLFYLAALLVLPYMGYSSLRAEIQTGTIELIEITSLSVRRRIRGRLQAVFSRLMLLYCVIGPFAVAAFMFGGISLRMILLSMYTFLVLSCVSVSVGLFFASLESSENFGSIIRFIYFLVLLTVFVSVFPFVDGARGPSIRFVLGGWRITTAYLIVLTLEGGLVTLFLCAASANVLTFEANKNAGRMKFIMLLLLLSGMISYSVIWLLLDGYPQYLISIERVSAMVLGITASFWMMLQSRVPAKLLEKLNHRSRWYRAIMYPFTDGPGSTMVFLILAFLLLQTGIAVLWQFEPLSGWHQVGGLFPILALVYAPYFSSCVRIIEQCVPVKYRNFTGRLKTFLLLLVGHVIIWMVWYSVLGLSLSAMSSFPYNTLAGLCPFIYMQKEPSNLRLVGLLCGLSVPILVGFVPHVYLGIRNMYRFCVNPHSKSQYPNRK